MSKPRLIQPIRHRRALVSLLAMAALLTGAQALAPSSAVAMNDENNDCASIPDEWERNLCEQDNGGTGSGGGSTTDDSGTTTGADTTGTPTPPPTYEFPEIFDHTFDRDIFPFPDPDLVSMGKTYAHCNRIWKKARRATHRRPHRLLRWLVEDPNDEWIQDYLHEQWAEYGCGDVFDLVGRP